MFVRVVIAPDSFKGTLTAEQAAQAIARGLAHVLPSVEIDLCPMADGGEGTLDVVLAAKAGRQIQVSTVHPLGRPIDAAYALLDDGEAWVELAAASGLMRMRENERDPEHALAATTFGTGVLLHHALEAGAKRICLTLGGSATTDGGYGLLASLGAKYFDHEGSPLSGRNANELAHLATIDVTEAIPSLQSVDVRVACDVRNPLCGRVGAAPVYGPQKGLDANGIARRDAELTRWAACMIESLHRARTMTDCVHSESTDHRKEIREWNLKSVLSTPGLGAAGGAALPLVLLAGAHLAPGAELVANAIGLKQAIARADIVITGEGRSDAQSVMGKVPAFVGQVAREFAKPCYVLSGSLGEGYEALYNCGITSVLAATPVGVSEDELAAHAVNWLTAAAEQLAVGL